jgi:hypothetical protein
VTRGDNNVAEANVVGIILVFLSEEVSNIGVTREVENLDFLVLLSITDRHVADVDMSHFLVGTVVAPINGTLVIIPKVSGELHVGHV